MNQPQISLSLRTAINLEKCREEIIRSNCEDSEKAQLCEEKIRKIGELLTPTESTVVGYLRLRSEIRTIHKNGLLATNEYGKHIVKRREFIRNINMFNQQQEEKFWQVTADQSQWGKTPEEVGITYIDEEKVQDTLLWVEPETWHIFSYEEFYGEPAPQAKGPRSVDDLPKEVSILATQLTTEYFAVSGCDQAGAATDGVQPAIASEAGQTPS